MSPADRLRAMAPALLRALSPRAKSLIVTVFGDSIAPHGGDVWLGSVIRLMAPFGLSERLVRTSVFRLAREDWLDGQAIGRRRYYGLSESGRRRFQAATRRIYAGAREPWDGNWRLVVAPSTGLGPTERKSLKRELDWLGFGAPAAGVYAHPDADTGALSRLLDEHGLRDHVAVFKARHDSADLEGLRRMIAQGWNLERLDSAYRLFLDRFRPVWQALDAPGRVRPETAFVIRSLLIHDFRRVILRDPSLPDELLPANWNGLAARRLTRSIYRKLWHEAEHHATAMLETAEGPLPELSAEFFDRFGGLTASGLRGTAA